MGLDMYLNAKRYIWSDENELSSSIFNLFKPPFKGEVKEVTFRVMYWRKANAIHKWFVDNVQEGEDDCKEYYVEKEMLEKLRDVCKEVLDKAILKDGLIINGYTSSKETNNEFLPDFEDGQYIVNNEEIHEILPTVSGFFFGSTNYDKFYYDDIKYTYETLDKLLNANDDIKKYDFYYSSSW